MRAIKSSRTLCLVAAVCLTSSVAMADVVLYATSLEGKKLIKLDVRAPYAATNPVTVFDTTDSPDSLVVDQQGRLIYDMPTANQVRMYNPQDNTDVLLAGAANGIMGPMDMVLDPNNQYVLVSNFAGNTITKITLTSPPVVTTLCCTGSGTTFFYPQGLAFDQQGNLFVVAGNGAAFPGLLYQIDPATGVILRTSDPFDPTNTPDGMTYDPITGHLFVTSRLGNELYEIDQATWLAGGAFSAIPRTNGGIPTPDGVIPDRSQDPTRKNLLYIVARGNFYVYAYNVLTHTLEQRSSAYGLDDLGATVLEGPLPTKAFNPVSIFAGQTSTLTITIKNQNTVPITNVSLTDTLPAGLVVATPNGLTGISGCGSNPPLSITATPGSNTISVSGAAMPANGICTFSVSVLGTIGALPPGVTYQNCITQVTAANSDPWNGSICASLVVLNPNTVSIQIEKAFTKSPIDVNETTKLTFKLTNPNSFTALTNITFTDPLPAGVQLATPAGLDPVTGCNNTLPVLTVGPPSTIALSGATLPANGGTCTFSVNVIGTTAGTKVNATTTVTTNEAPPGGPATATLVVNSPLQKAVIEKAFAKSPIVVNETTALILTVRNPNTVPLTGISFTDTMPVGITVATPNGLNPVTGCNGTVPVTTATTLTLTNATLPASGSCQFSINVVGVSAGTFTNTTSSLSSNEAPPGTPATAPIEVINQVEAITDAYQVRYASNLDIGDSVVNITNTGTLNGNDPAGRICVNVYTFDYDEEMVSCCSCMVTPNAVASLSVQKDLISNPLTPVVPTSVVIKLLATQPNNGTCDPGAGGFFTQQRVTLAPGLRAWGTTLHQVTKNPSTWAMTETPFSISLLSQSELSKVASLCSFIRRNGSGFGTCNSCRNGALGADKH